MPAKPFHLGWFLTNSFGVHGWMQEWGGRLALDWSQPDLHIDLARAAERACLDFILLEDSSFIPDAYGGSMDFYLARGSRAPKNDPLPLVPLMTQATRRIGIVPTISTSFYPPYLLARLMATLDLMSGGRVGCNFVTSTAQRAAQNFGLDDHIPHDVRYQMADEFVEVATKLWESWAEDAIRADPDDRVYVDPAKVRAIDFKGRYFASRGPLNTARPPQGRPVMVQAGNSPQGRQFAAKHMDVVVGAAKDAAEMKAFRDDIRDRVAAAGRDPDRCKVLFYFIPVLGSSSQEAQDRYGRMKEQARSTPEETLAMMASLTDIDFSKFDIDAQIGDITTNGQQGALRQFLAQGRTLREIADNYRFGLEDLVGTPDQVADAMGDLMHEVGGDGFMIAGAVTRRYIAEITDGLVPALQKRGLMRTGFAHEQFRDNLLDF